MHIKRKQIFSSYRYLCMIFVLVYLPASYLSGQKLADRLILEIDRQTYSQRYMEAYFIVKFYLSSYLHYPTAKSSKLNDANYKEFFDNFAQDMLISTEAKKLGRYQPTSESLDVFLKLFDDPKPFADEMIARLKELDISHGKLTRMVSDVIQIDEFRKNKDTSHKKQSFWIDELKENHMIRIFSGAQNYQPI